MSNLIEQAKKIRADMDEKSNRLLRAEDKLQSIWSLLPDPSDIPTLPQLIKMLAKIRKIREDKK